MSRPLEIYQGNVTSYSNNLKFYTSDYLSNKWLSKKSILNFLKDNILIFEYYTLKNNYTNRFYQIIDIGYELNNVLLLIQEFIIDKEVKYINTFTIKYPSALNKRCLKFIESRHTYFGVSQFNSDCEEFTNELKEQIKFLKNESN
jgi:hypothetical protein